MSKCYYLYQITNNINGKNYVGVHQTVNLDDGYMGSGKVINSAIKKYGKENFSKVILEYFDNEETMYAREKEVVTEEYLLREDSYNLKRGGNGGFDYINSTGIIKFAGKRHNEESKKKMGHPGNSYFGGHKHSEECKFQQGERAKSRFSGIPKTEEHRINIRKSTNMRVYEIVCCPNCGKLGAKNAMKRWHFENCKAGKVFMDTRKSSKLE